MICAFFWLRARRIDSRARLSSEFSWLPECPLQNCCTSRRIARPPGFLTSKDYHASLKTNLTRSGVSASGVDVDYISALPWIVTEDFTDDHAEDLTDTISGRNLYRQFQPSLSPVHLWVDDGAQGA